MEAAVFIAYKNSGIRHPRRSVRASCILHLKLAQRPDRDAFIPCDLLYLAARQAIDKRNIGTVDYFENRIHS